MSTTKPLKPGKPGMSGKKGKKPGLKPGMTRLRTVWITEPSQNSFEEDYQTIKQIGEPGQFGKAYQCKRKSDGLIVAAKEISKARIYRLHPSDNIRQSLLKSMQCEIDIMKRLKHKYIVNMYGTYETKHNLHIIMEECKGGELFDRIKSKRRYLEKDAKPIIKMMVNALHYMHDQHRVVHCDLKPDNILFVDKSEDSDIKIIDFGMSKVLPRLRSLRELCGTPYYTAPEIINGDYSHAADMWSVGVIAYVMIFGFPPFYVDPNKYHGVKETKEIYKLILKGFDPTVKKGYGAWFPRALEKKLSADGKDFMSGLMEKDVAKRLTAKEALQHPFLQTDEVNTDTSSTPSTQSQDSNLDLTGMELGNFANAHQFKFAITALFRDQYQTMRPKHFENLHKVFNEMDKDNNGKISYEEFEEGMLKTQTNLDKAKIQKMFKELDLSKSGEIDFNNFLNAAVHDYLVASDVRLYKAFRDLDKNEDGYIATNALKQKIKDLNPYGNVDMILQIIDDVDLDNDGTIDYEEFLRALHPDFNETPNWFWGDDIQKNEESDDENEGGNNEDDNKENDNNEDYNIDFVDPEIDEETKKHAQKLSQVKNANENDNKKKSGKKGVVKQGWMQKEGKMVKSWKKRWFVLDDQGILKYYHNENETEHISQVNVKTTKKLMNKSWSKTNKKRYGIKVYTPHRNWKFLLVNNDQRAEWMSAFEKVSGKKAGNKPTKD